MGEPIPIGHGLGGFGGDGGWVRAEADPVSADHAGPPLVVLLPAECLAAGERGGQIVVAYGEGPGGFQAELPQAAAGVDLERPQDAAMIEHVA